MKLVKDFYKKKIQLMLIDNLEKKKRGIVGHFDN